MDQYNETPINSNTYQWSVRIFSMLKRVLSVNIKMHHAQGQIAAGEIFLFNHFARFETFIPQYLIYQETGALCRSVAASEFFQGDDAFASYLLSVGAIPNNYPRLIPFLAEEILRGRKVIVFPEGGIVKDRRVQNRRGRYRIYSRSADRRRKHHLGAAVLSLTVDVLKQSIRQAFTDKESATLDAWMERLGFEERSVLFEAVQRPSTIVPANITFYPMRVGDNLLHRSVELFNRGINRRLSEEVLIESNILLKNTDMDIRLGDTVYSERCWRWWEQPLIRRFARDTRSLDELTAPLSIKRDLGQQFLASRIRKTANQLRNHCMRAMYAEITVNLSHLASLFIYQLLERGQLQINTGLFRKTLYLAVKNAQKIPTIKLHRSLENPDAYSGLIANECSGLDQFFRTAAQLELIEVEDHQYQFMPKLCKEHTFDSVRVENMIEVYANEVQPIEGIDKAIQQAIVTAEKISQVKMAEHLFDDQKRAYHWDRHYFSKPRFQKINRKETATASAEPFLLLPKKARSIGILLSHGFLASPAEVRPFGELLAAQGYPVIGPRLKGHGTSPWDLRAQHWQDWLESLRQSYRILSAHCDRICMVGFSTGGALSLLLAAEQPDCLVATVAISVPLKFRNKNLIFVPLAHHANKLVRWLPAYEGIIPFRTNDSDHPDINYRSIPVHALFELRLMVSELGERLPEVHCPTLLFQADQDTVIEPHSADIILDRLGSEEKNLHNVITDRHGILYENIDNTQGVIIRYLNQLEERENTLCPSPKRGESS